MKWILLASFMACAVSSSLATRVVCYYPNWAFYRPDPVRYTADNIDPTLCTHLIYGFATLDASTYTIQIFDNFVDIDNEMYIKFNSLKRRNPILKTMIAVGGWNEQQSSKYSQLVADPLKIANFVNSVVTFLKAHEFDGLDLDWEFPSPNVDLEGDERLLKALRAAFEPHGFILSAAVSALQVAIDEAYSAPSINKYTDFINLMAYDMHGSWELQADHHAPLFKRPWDKTDLDVDFSVNYWMQKGMPASKINLGIPMYGRSWVLSSNQVDPPAPASGAGTAGPLTRESGFLTYFEICNFTRNGGWQVKTDPDNLQGPSAFSPSTRNWVGYDDVAMVIVKSKYVLSKGLGGVVVWDISMDDFTNTCGDGANPLIKAVAQTIGVTNTIPESRSVIANQSITTSESSTIIETTTTPLPVTTDEPETTEWPVSIGFSCPEPNGLFVDPSDCSRFYICHFPQYTRVKCPDGLFFNEALSVCDWSYKVTCTLA